MLQANSVVFPTGTFTGLFLTLSTFAGTGREKQTCPWQYQIKCYSSTISNDITKNNKNLKEKNQHFLIYFLKLITNVTTVSAFFQKAEFLHH
jgi:hypothetical protein